MRLVCNHIYLAYPFTPSGYYDFYPCCKYIARFLQNLITIALVHRFTNLREPRMANPSDITDIANTADVSKSPLAVPNHYITDQTV